MGRLDVEALLWLPNFTAIDHRWDFTLQAEHLRITTFYVFTELTIKQEEETAQEETAQEADDRSPALEEIGQTGEEGGVLEESMTGSPSNIQDGSSGPNMTADAGSRQPNGTDQYISKCH